MAASKGTPRQGPSKPRRAKPAQPTSGSTRPAGSRKPKPAPAKGSSGTARKSAGAKSKILVCRADVGAIIGAEIIGAEIIDEDNVDEEIISETLVSQRLCVAYRRPTPAVTCAALLRDAHRTLEERVDG